MLLPGIVFMFSCFSAAMRPTTSLPQDASHTFDNSGAHIQNPTSYNSGGQEVTGSKTRLKGRSDDYIANDHWRLPVPVSKIGCHHKDRFNTTDYRKAVDHLKTYCDTHQISSGSMYVAVVGEVAVYVCSEQGITPCHRNEWDDAEKHMDSQCGLTMAGYAKAGRWGKIYGRDVMDRVICPRLNMNGVWDHDIRPLPVWVNGSMYELVKEGKVGLDG